MTDHERALRDTESMAKYSIPLPVRARIINGEILTCVDNDPEAILNAISVTPTAKWVLTIYWAKGIAELTWSGETLWLLDGPDVELLRGPIQEYSNDHWDGTAVMTDQKSAFEAWSAVTHEKAVLIRIGALVEERRGELYQLLSLESSEDIEHRIAVRLNDERDKIRAAAVAGIDEVFDLVERCHGKALIPGMTEPVQRN